MDKPEINYAASLELDNPCYVDIRSPGEYAADHIPGALHLPLFDDGQRAKIGMIYHNISEGQAELAGLEIALPRLPGLLAELAMLHRQGRTPVLYCWRGGLRSQKVREAAALHGIPCLRLAGGYREYRRRVLDLLDKPLPYRVITLHGLTGCGKTAVLKLLKQCHYLQTLDLEDIAKHRGSVFGHIGLDAQPTQKYFQSLLAGELCGLNNTEPLLLEGESRRVGKLLLPDSLYEAIKCGMRILLYDSLEGRIHRLLEEYVPAQHVEEVRQALESEALRAKFSAVRLREMSRQVQNEAYAEVIEYLLIHYYDPLYHYPGKPAPGYDLCVDSGNEERAAVEIAEFIAKF